MSDRLQGIREVREARERGDVDYLISELTDASATVRSSAIRALGLLGGARATQPLLRLLNASDIGTRYSRTDESCTSYTRIVVPALGVCGSGPGHQTDHGRLTRRKHRRCIEGDLNAPELLIVAETSTRAIARRERRSGPP
jgi:hypothetical protein